MAMTAGSGVEELENTYKVNVFINMPLYFESNQLKTADFIAKVNQQFWFIFVEHSAVARADLHGEVYIHMIIHFLPDHQLEKKSSVRLNMNT